ncbi:predicted protein [Sclerotinia sclerotiorum 1980 UF-70]|uniref:Uncharacterized protein n=1 Tax=Sclerotinia sclerotiorum (strain ATCC 18683 / 1980 / Ss-1) TaxID=665079 RepID=A7EY81_SCLS1|nr:predicted protein [Sclerotinia sclerotiorum 1980 UF-70]EDN94423.1 predicted protein [Sclerotinia sclerotiorum 1980 UF-70]
MGVDIGLYVGEMTDLVAAFVQSAKQTSKKCRKEKIFDASDRMLDYHSTKLKILVDFSRISTCSSMPRLAGR